MLIRLQRRKTVGFCKGVREINVDSICPREIEIVRRNESKVTIGVEYPWLFVKCKVCKGFGHATYACTKQEKKI